MAIYRLMSCQDDDFPVIDWRRHPAMADVWIQVDARHKAGQPYDELLAGIRYRLRLTPGWPRVDCIGMAPGIAVSESARRRFETLGVPGMRFLEFKVNKDSFFRFHTERVVDCLDRSASEIEFFPTSGRVMKVLRYAFRLDLLLPCDVFTVPELSQGMFFWSQQTFMTAEARRAIEESRLVGFRFEELPGPPSAS
jgi:hypothetical protein